MDGNGRALDNIFIERLWRSVKYKCVYAMNFARVAEARQYIGEYFIYRRVCLIYKSLCDIDYAVCCGLIRTDT
jgi:putative transposase